MAVLTQPRSRRLARPRGLAWRRALWGYVFISPWIIGFLVFTLGPMIATLGFTFTNINLEQAEPLSSSACATTRSCSTTRRRSIR